MIVRILERDPRGTLYLQCESENGTIEVITDVQVANDTALLDQLHVDGPGVGLVGVQDPLRFARDLGRQLGVGRVVIQGGRRTTGANPGRMPRPIVIRVKEDDG